MAIDLLFYSDLAPNQRKIKTNIIAVVRRNQIDELTRAIESLKESWLDLYSDEEKVGHRVE